MQAHRPTELHPYQPLTAPLRRWPAAAAALMAATLLLSACRPIAGPSLDLVPVPPLDSGPALPSPEVPFPGSDQLVIVPVATQPPTPTALPALPTATRMPEALDGPVQVGIDRRLPQDWALPLMARLTASKQVVTDGTSHALQYVEQVDSAGVELTLRPLAAASHPVALQVLAVVAPFETVRDDVTTDELLARLQDPAANGALFVSSGAALAAGVLLGEGSQTVERSELLATLEANPGALGVALFEELDPRFKALTVNGANVLDNQLVISAYPLVMAVTAEGPGSGAVKDLLTGVLPPTNRDRSQMTTLLMTGVTAMARGTAAMMERMGYTFPADVISATFAAADITHISNEIPFLDDCVVNNTENNLILCSHVDYWATLAAVGTDIVGLSGNHVNDFGREGARRSLGWYRENKIPIYGSGMTIDEACAPLLWEDHGNKFAFIAALAYQPSGAWATADQPGACYYYDNKERLLQLIGELKEQADVIAVELQYEETYNPYPTPGQVIEFRELREAGAHIVTGVQSHVPQAQEPYGLGDPGGAGIISYGLGNLFFDQMWSYQTRTELAARHTIYQGRVLSTEILTMVLEDYAQPRWTTAEERADLLQSIFNGAPARASE